MPLTLGTVCAALGLAVVACKDHDSETQTASVATEPSTAARDAEDTARQGRGAVQVGDIAGKEPGDASQAFVVDAHNEALTAAIPQVEAVLTLVDPVAAAAIGESPLRPVPIRAARLAELDRALADADKAVAEIDPRHLEPPRRTLLRVARFALERARWHQRERPWHGDPEWVVLETTRFVEAIEDLMWTDQGSAAAEALAALAPELDVAREGLRATSRPVATAAADDWRHLVARVRELPLPREEAARQAWIQARKTASTAMRELATRLEHATGNDERRTRRRRRDKRGRSSSDDGGESRPIRRLPDRLTRQQLHKRLEVEEAIHESSSALFDAVGYSLDRIDGFARRLSYRKRGRKTPVDDERCESLWTPLERWSRTEPAVSAASLDCADVLPRLQARGAIDDTELTRMLVHLGIVVPSERERRRQQPDIIALLDGDFAPAVHPRALTVATLTAIAHPSLRLELKRARNDLCLAATALWIHGRLGPRAVLGKRLHDRCPAAKPNEWIDRAIARPRASLRGLGLVALGLGPAEVVALEQYWWAPLGLVDSLARPGHPPADPPKAVVESLSTSR